MICVKQFVCLVDEEKGCNARVRICGTCGFNSIEAERRKHIPVTFDEKTGTHRKFIRKAAEW